MNVRRFAAVLLAGTAMGLTAAPAVAQTAPAAPAQAPDDAGQAEATAAAQTASGDDSASTPDIVVTGSRISNPNAASATPVASFNADQLLASQPATIAAALNNLPQLVAVGGTQANAGTQSAGKATLNLRGLGTTRTLTLLDGMRLAPTTTVNTFDTNLLPQGLISNVDIVSGGASAAYGSDAVAGVVNFILDKKFTGLKADLSGGVSQRGDNAEYRASVVGGTSFAGGRGHALLAGEYFQNRGVEGDARAFRRAGDNILNNPSGSPTLITAPDVRVPYTYGGIITAATGGTAAANRQLVGTQFFPGGGYGPFNYGTLSTATNQSGGDGINTAVLQPIARPLDRRTAFGRASYDLSDNLTAFAQGFYGYSRSSSYTAPYRLNAGALTIQRDNAFLPAALRAQMTALGISSFTLSRYDSEYQTTLVDTTYSGTAMGGVSGKIADLTWGISGQYGETLEKTPLYFDPLLTNGRLAADAVVNPANGQIVCRSTLTNPGNGCVPFNPFGAGSPSAASIGYVTATNDVRTHLSTRSMEGHLSGTLFEGWAGPILFATGAEYRDQRASVDSNPLSINRQFLFANTAPWSGRYEVTEGFGELNVPVVKDQTLVHSLDLNGAARLTHYSTSGTVTTWKAGLNYEPVAGLRFRVTQSRDIRAPNLSELYTASVQNTATVTDPFRNNVRVSNLPVIISGNSALRPEISNTTTVGVSLADIVPGLSLSVDGYRIKVNDVIATPTPQQVLDQCSQGASSLCGFISRDAGGALTTVATPFVNFASLFVRGIDFDAAYRLPRDRFVPGRIQVRAVASYLANLRTVTPGAAPVDRAGDLGQQLQATPKWRGQGSIDYTVGALSTFVQLRYIGAGRYNTAPTAPSANLDHIPATLYVDGQIGVKVSDAFELDLNVQNLFDRDPRFVPLNSNVNVTTNANLYDQIGRMFRVIAKVRF